MTIACDDCSVTTRTENTMSIYTNIETPVLFTMLSAHASYYRKLHNKKSLTNCKRTINRIKSEIEIRQKFTADNTVLTPVLNMKLAS